MFFFITSSFVCLHFSHSEVFQIGLHIMLGCSEDSGVIFAIVGPAKWVGPSVELALIQRSMILVVIVGLSTNDQMVDITEVNLGWSLRLLVLEHHLLGDSSLLDTLGSHLNEDEVIVVAGVLPAEWVGPSVELGSVGDIEFSLENVVVILTEVNLGWTL